MFAPFAYPFYEGVALATEVPDVYPVALAGRPYLLDLKADQFRHLSIPLMRQQADDSSSPSESSLNPDDLWRRAQDSWHHGAGQTFRDREEGNPFRFRSSKGIDPWTKYQFGLLPDVELARASANTNLQLVPAGSRLYLVDGDELLFSTNLSAWTAVTGDPGNPLLSVASDGFNVWVTDGTNVYETTRTTGAMGVYNTLDCDLLAYVKGRLMAAHENSLYNIVSGSPPAALFSHANTDFRWVGFAEGRAALYAAGFSGDKSLIYRITVKADGSALDQPILAGDLPDGEVVTSIGGYLGFLVIGTTKGVHFAPADAQGNLTIGPLIETGDPARCFEGQDRFVWFGWSDYDSDPATGLGRLDLSVFTEELTPAYASDLMAPVAGDVLSVATFLDIRVFTVSGSGVWAQDTNLVPSGKLTTGLIGFGLPDQKQSLYVDTRTEPLDGSWSVAIAHDSSPFATVGTESNSDDLGEEFPTGEALGERFELEYTLTRAAVPTLGPVITRYTLKVNPTAELREFIFVPLLLHEVENVNDEERTRDVGFEKRALKSLRATRALVRYQEGSETYSVAVEDYEWIPHHETNNRQSWNGTFLAKLKVI